ncbi:MAG: outer membrane protein assembly factor BamA [Desulfofustis sp.]|nr:outer membrane protein assembly factor BamA [Desulfofustis sp.]
MLTENNFPKRFTTLFRLCFISVCACCALVATLAPSAAAVEQTTAYLPFQIVAPQVDDRLTATIDDSLTTALLANDFQMVDRATAERIVDYSIWPPSRNALEKIAQETGYDNVAAGTVTFIGSQASIDVKVFDLFDPDNPRYFFREADSVEDLNLVIGQVISEVVSFSERQQLIGSITPEGNTRIDSGAILRKIQSKVGGAYDQDILREDLKAIYSMGYFDDVQIDVKDSRAGKAVTFRVVEKPAISSISYSGIKELDDDDVTEVVTIKANSILNPARVNDSALAIQELYKSKGYYNTKVTPEISYPTAETAAVKFTIEEGKKIYIKAIDFEGNLTFDDDDLEDVIETNTKGFFSWLTSSGLLNRDKLAQDSTRIVAFYNNNGFLEARVGEPIVTQDEEWLYIKFIVEEGPRFKVGTVAVEGELIADQEVFLDMLEVRKEEYLSRKTLRDDIIKITDYYSEQGYAFAEVRPKLDKSETGSRVDIVLDITRGDLVYVNRISISGNTRTRDNVIRRDLEVEEGGVFNASGLRDSSRALQRLDFFEEVTITPEPALDPSKMNIDVKVKEKSTGQFSIGAGYSSVDNLILMGEISENNFLGLGHRLALSANIGGRSSRFNLAWTDPRVFDSNLSAGIDLFNWEREYDDYTKDSKGGAVRFGHPLWGHWRMYESYSYTDTTLTDVAEDASFIIRESQNIPVTSAVKVSFVRDTRDRLYGASEGSRNAFSVKYAGGPLGGDSQFTKAEAASGWYFPMPFKTVYRIAGEVGQAWENETGKLPVYERYYLGGMNSIRGHEYGQVSPIDPKTGDRVGGDQNWFVQNELIVPLFKQQGIYGVVFVDVGNAIATEDDNYNRDTAVGTGFEFRWLSPMGPLRLVWGYNPDPLEDEPESVWDFSIGGQF